jgi:hypothetical protein
MNHGLSERDIADLTGVAKKGLQFDFYIFRKAYGTYYAIWATAILLFVYLPFLTYFPSISQFIPYVFFSVYLTVFILAMWVTRKVFRNATEIIGFKSIFNEKRRNSLEMRFLGILSIFMFVVLIIIISFYGITNLFTFLIFYGVVIIISLHQLKNLRLTFGNIPIEGTISLISYLLSIVLSLSSVIVGKSQLDFSLSWLPAIFGWYFSALYSRYSSKKFLEEFNV